MLPARPLPTLAALQAGDRACLIYQSEDEHRQVVAEYLRQGLEQGHKALYLAVTRDPAEVLDGLARAGLDVAPYLAAGRLEVLALAETGAGDPADLDALIEWLRAAVGRARAETYPALRVTSEFSALLRRLRNTPDPVAVEVELDRLVAGGDCLLMCQYDRRDMDPGVLLEVLRGHPLAIVGGHLFENPYFVPPAELQKPQAQAARLQVWLDEMGRQRELSATLERRLAIEQAMATISGRLQQVPDLNAAIQATLQDLAALAGASRAGVFRLRAGGSRLDNTHEWCAPGVTPRVELRQNLPTARFPWLLRAFDRGEVLYLPDLGALPPDAAGDHKLLLDRQVRSLLALPLRFGTRLVGVLGLENPDAVRDWPEPDLTLLRMAGMMVSGAVERRLAERDAGQRASQLAALQEVGLALAAELDPDRLLQAIVQQAVDLAAATGGSFYRHDPERDCLLRAVSIGDNPLPLGTARRRGEGLSGRVWAQNRPLVVADYAAWEGRAGDIHPLIPAGVLGVPVRWGESLLGVLSVSARPAARAAFGPRDIELLEMLATQAAIAIRNSQLLAQAGRRAERLAVVNRIGRAASGQLELDELLAAVYREVSLVFSLDSFFIALLDAPAGELDFRLLMDGGEQLPAERFPLGFGLASLVVESGAPLRVADLHQKAELQARTATRGSEGLPRSWLGVPLRAGDELLGVISMQSARPSLYNQDDQQLLDTIADQLALALKNAQLFEAERESRLQAEALNAIMTAAAAAEDLGALMDAVLDQCLLALGLSIGAIWISGQYRIRGLPADIGFASREAVVAAGMSGLETSRVEDFAAIPPGHPAAPLAQVMLRYGLRAVLTVPVTAAGRRVGGVSLASPRPHAWSQREVALMDAVGRQVDATLQRLQLLEQVRAEAQRLQATIDSVPEGVLLLDAGRRVLLANPLAESYLDRLAANWRPGPLETLAGRPLDALLAPPPEGLWHELAQEGNGQRVYELAGRPLGQTGRETGWVLVLRDVSQEREIQDRIQQQERLAAVGQLAAGIAHDFNNIMAVIILYSQLTGQMGGLPGAARDRMRTIDQQARSASELIAQILDFSRSAVLERRPLNLVGLLKEQTKLLERTLPESIRVEFATDHPECIVSADPTRVQQAVTNLAINARDAMPAGGQLTFALSRFELAPGAPPPLPGLAAGNWVCLAVSDTGHGIPAASLSHIFDPFFTTKERGKGTGLGLAQVHGIVKQHDGEVGVESQVGRGTTFRIYLPDARVDAAPEETQPAPPILGRGETVLVVEDDPVVRRALEGSLEALNYRVITARNGVEALDLYARNAGEIAAVLSDLVMPEMGGRELFEMLRGANPQLRMALLTGHPLQTELEELAQHGLAGWLLKPARLETLSELMARLLGR